jgi:putative copper resistance protein D
MSLILAMDAMPIPAPLGWNTAFQFSFAWAPTLLIVLYGAVYLALTKRWEALTARTWSKKRSVITVAALLCVFLSAESAIGTYDMTLFSAHMIQHLLLIMVSSALFAMGAPLQLLLEACPGKFGRVLNRLADSKPGEVLGLPAIGFGAYAIFIPVTHLTGLFNFMMEHLWAHHAEQLGFLIVGYLFWRPVVGIEPMRHPLGPGQRLVFLALAVPIDTFTGLALAMNSYNTVPALAEMHRTWGPGILSDLHTGGAIMWIGGDFLMLIAMGPVAYNWMKSEEIKAREIDAILDAQRDTQAP